MALEARGFERQGSRKNCNLHFKVKLDFKIRGCNFGALVESCPLFFWIHCLRLPRSASFVFRDFSNDEVPSALGPL